MNQYSVSLTSFHSKKKENGRATQRRQRKAAPPKEDGERSEGKSHHRPKDGGGRSSLLLWVGAAFPSFAFGWGLLSLYPLAGGAVFSPLLLWVVLFFILLGGSIFPICFEK